MGALHGMYSYTIREYETFSYDDVVDFWIACEAYELKQTERLITTMRRLL